jgi:hypothetical protein
MPVLRERLDTSHPKTASKTSDKGGNSSEASALVISQLMLMNERFQKVFEYAFYTGHFTLDTESGVRYNARFSGVSFVRMER